MRKVGFRNTDPRVDTRDLEPFHVCRYFNADMAAVGCILQGIVQQVRNQTLQHVTVAADEKVITGQKDQSNPPFFSG